MNFLQKLEIENMSREQLLAELELVFGEVCEYKKKKNYSLEKLKMDVALAYFDIDIL